VLNNEEEAKLAEKYRLQGVTRSGIDGIDVDVLGGKYNMTDIAAAIGLGSLRNCQQSPRSGANWRGIISPRWARISRRRPVRNCRPQILNLPTGICSRSCCRTVSPAPTL